MKNRVKLGLALIVWLSLTAAVSYSSVAYVRGDEPPYCAAADAVRGAKTDCWSRAEVYGWTLAGVLVFGATLFGAAAGLVWLFEEATEEDRKERLRTERVDRQAGSLSEAGE